MFEPKRFARLAAAQWTENRRTYAWFFGVGIIVHFVLVLVMLSTDRGYQGFSTDGQAGVYFTGLFLTAPIFAARYFQAMGRRESALLLLMRPASVAEKWLLAVLVVLVLYPVVYSLAFYVCNLPAWAIAQGMAAHALEAARVAEQEYLITNLQPEKYQLFAAWSWFLGEDAEGWQGIYLLLAMFQGFALLGSLYFRSMPFIKTVVAAFLLLLASIFLGIVSEGRIDLFLSYWDREDELAAWQAWAYPVAWFVLPALLWLASFFALQERELG